VRRFSELQKVSVSDPDLDLGSGQGHINIHSTYIQRSMNSHDSFSGRKFHNWTQRSCRTGPILSLSTVTFKLHAKTAEETDLEKCDFCNFTSSMTLTLTLDQVEVILVCICGRHLPTHQIRPKLEKVFVDVRIDGHDFQ